MRNLSILGCFFLLACGGGNEGSGVGERRTTPSGSRTDEAVRELCVASGANVDAVDVNNDGTPDIRHVLDNGRRRCTEIDMNFDGRVDVVRFFEADGQTLLREEHDFDFDGRFDQIAVYEAGQLTHKELDTNFNDRIDTWLWCQDGRVSRAERDRTNSGRVDTWEVYERGILTEARYDDDNDGEPEKFEVFRDGRLVEIRYDTDRDGNPDRAEEIAAEQAGQPEAPLLCVVEATAPAPETPSAPPPTVDEGEGEGDSNEATEADNEDAMGESMGGAE
jgi:hypothetical protein